MRDSEGERVGARKRKRVRARRRVGMREREKEWCTKRWKETHLEGSFPRKHLIVERGQEESVYHEEI